MAIETILLAVGSKDVGDESQLAQTVRDIAQPLDATVVLLHAYKEDELSEMIDALDYTPDEKPSPDEVAQRHQIIRSIAKEFEDREIDYSVRGTVGTPAKSILEVASETDTNLLCIGGEERSPAGKAIFGSTAQKILLNAPCPVVFVREETFESK